MFFVVIAAAVLQAQLPGFTTLGQAKFPLLMAVVIYYSLNHEFAVMLTTAFFAGLINDALGNIPLGYSSVCFCLIGLIISRFQRLVVTESPLTTMFFGGVAGFVSSAFLYMFLSSGGYVSWPAGRLTVRFLGSGLLGMVCAPLVLVVVLNIDQLVGNVRIRKEVSGDTFE